MRMKKQSSTSKIRKGPKPYSTAHEVFHKASSNIEETQALYMARNMNNVIDFMGMSGKKHFTDLGNEADFIQLIRKGVPKKVLDHLMTRIGLTSSEMAFILHVSDRTLRRHTPQTLLNQEQSERLIELARLYSRGEDVFGGLESFKRWMNSPILALGNVLPKDLLDTSLGIDMLMDELGRMEHGVFA